MTLVVAFIAQNGWVLASDRCLYQTGWSIDPTTNQSTTGTLTTTTQKIYYDEPTGIVYSFAGDSIAALAGELLLSKAKIRVNEFSKTGTGTLLNEVGNEIFQKHIDHKINVRRDINRQLLILLLKKRPIELWTLSLGASSMPTLCRDKALIGDITNGAKLFWQLYYSSLQTLEQLQILAAHIILMGHECNAGLVEGLEMWTGNASGVVQPVEQGDLQSLVKHCSKIDKGIARLFGVKQLSRWLRL